MDKYKFGEFLYQRRKKINLTQDELGRRLGVTNKAVSKWETGETLPEVSMLAPLANVLNITIDELLTQKDNQSINKHNIRINRFFLIGIIVLVCLEILTIVLFTLNNNKKVIIDVNQNDINKYITINPLYEFDIEGQEIYLTSSYKLDNKYLVKQEIELEVDFTITFYYYKDDNNVGVITYYHRTSEMKFIDNDLLLNVLTVEPKNNIEGFKGLKKIEVKYLVIKAFGQIELIQ